MTYRCQHSNMYRNWRFGLSNHCISWLDDFTGSTLQVIMYKLLLTAKRTLHIVCIWGSYIYLLVSHRFRKEKHKTRKR